MSAISSQHRFSQELSVRRATNDLRRSERWAVILAGGDGTRLQSMTRSITGDDRPKQFVPVIGGRTLITLLGITPTSPETEYGWIEPQQSILGTMPLSITRVSRFWEKPDSDMAHMLLDNGCLWNSFVMVGRVDALLEMTRRALPNMYSQFASTMSTFET